MCQFRLRVPISETETELIPGIMTSSPVAFLYHNFFIFLLAHEEQQKRSNEEEYNIHNTKREGCFEHCACLVESERERGLTTEAIIV